MIALGRWSANVYIVGHAAVGGVLETAGKDWEAFGCQSDWGDTPLGTFRSKSAAKNAIDNWVAEFDSAGDRDVRL